MHAAPPAVHFLGIGAQKAATSWLWVQLGSHPDIWLPPRKELHYFDRALRYASPSHLATESRWTRATGDSAHDRRLRDLCRTEIARALREKRVRDACWLVRYFWGGRSPAWYRSLFAGAAGRVTGEITPAYAILDADDVAQVAAALPAVKVLFLLRNPIERAWSHVRFAAGLGGPLSAGLRLDDTASIIAFIDSPVQELRSDYVRTLDLWSRHVPPERFWIGFHDDVERDALPLLHSLYDFLGVRLNHTPAPIAMRVNASHPTAMPAEVRAHLVRKYEPLMRALSQHPLLPANAHVARWLDER